MRAPGLLSLSHLVTEVVGDVKTSKSLVGDLDRKAWLDKGNDPPATWLRVVGRETSTFPNGTEVAIRPLIAMNEAYFHNMVICEFMVPAAVSVAMIGLIVWHAVLISRGETSIEVHLNKKERKRQEKQNLVFRNPYDFGFRENWRLFFGVNAPGKTWWRHVLFPSNHKPPGDGLTFRRSHHVGTGKNLERIDENVV